MLCMCTVSKGLQWSHCSDKMCLHLRLKSSKRIGVKRWLVICSKVMGLGRRKTSLHMSLSYLSVRRWVKKLLPLMPNTILFSLKIISVLSDIIQLELTPIGIIYIKLPSIGEITSSIYCAGTDNQKTANTLHFQMTHYIFQILGYLFHSHEVIASHWPLESSSFKDYMCFVF